MSLTSSPDPRLMIQGGRLTITMLVPCGVLEELTTIAIREKTTWEALIREGIVTVIKARQDSRRELES